MARLVVVQQRQPGFRSPWLSPHSSLLPSSLSEFNGTGIRYSAEGRRRGWQSKGGLKVSASSTKDILSTGVFLSRLLAKVNLFTRGKLPITQQLPGETDEKDAVSRRDVVVLLFSSSILTQSNSSQEVALAEPLVEFREHIDKFDGYTFLYPKNWIQVRGAGADIFFRDPYVLDENLSVELSSPSSSKYISVEDLGSPQAAAEKVLKQYLTEFMSTRIGVRRESNVLSTSSRVADDGKVYYQVEVNIKSYATSNEMAVMPKDRVLRLEWDRRYLSVLGVENNRLYELRLQTPENVFVEEENDLRRVMQSFRVIKSVA